MRVQRLFLIAALLACFSNATWASPERVLHQNRFGTLTSEVWRYGGRFEPRDLSPIPNNNPYPEPQPNRDRPTNVTLSTGGDKLYVTLQGTEEKPAKAIAVVNTATLEVIKRIEVGSRPYGGFLYPGGAFLVIINELSNYASVIATESDTVCGQIPLDFYSQGLAFSKAGDRAWIANRALNQVLVVDLSVADGCLSGKVHEIGGFDEAVFRGVGEIPASLKNSLSERGFDQKLVDAAVNQGAGGINGILRARCQRCHNSPTGGFLSGDDRELNFLSAVENSVGGNPRASVLLRAVTPQGLGGFGDQVVTPEFHPGGAIFAANDPDLAKIQDWIRNAQGGPGIPVGNEDSHPKDVVLSSDGRHLFVGNTGTLDVSIIDTEANLEVGAIYIQNATNFLTLHRGVRTDTLLVLTLGAGFGTAKERDPHGGETWDRNNPAAQFTVLRDPDSTDPYPLERQSVMGPFEAVDGTWNIKMRDIQNDIVAIDASALKIPKGERLDYVLRANHYESHAGWVRYTSDTAEATSGDIKGDIPPELQRVHGAFPAQAVVEGDHLYVSMSGSFEIVEWLIQPDATDTSEKLVPLRVFKTGLHPVGLAVGTTGPAKGKLFVANRLGETLSVIDIATAATREVAVGDLTRPALDTDGEKGELIAHSSVFSSDGDSSCAHCHIRDTGDGRSWGAAETVGQNHAGHLVPGGTLGIPQIRNIFAIQPFYFEGTHLLGEGQGADISEPASSIDFDRPIWAGDFSALSSPVPDADRHLMHEELKERVTVHKLGKSWYDLEERRDAFLRAQSIKYFGAGAGLADLFRYMGAWMGSATHLLPQPFDRLTPSVLRGQALFNSAQVMCGVCHAAPEFTNKSRELADNDRRALPQLTTETRRDGSYTLASVRAVDVANGRTFDFGPDDKGRVEEREGSFTTISLRGLFDRPPVFLHHGRARSLREVLLTPGHPAAREFRYPVLLGDEDVRPGRREIGFNETTKRLSSGQLDRKNQVIDSHGGTSHLTIHQIDDLLNFLRTIE